MSSSSVNSAIRDGLRFRNIDCGCGKRASVRISESSLNKNKLYYYCATNRCGFFSWCLPINQRAGCERIEEISQATSSKSMVDASQLHPWLMHHNCYWTCINFSQRCVACVIWSNQYIVMTSNR